MKRVLSVWGALLGGFGVGWVGASDPVPYIWTGGGLTSNMSVTNPANWQGGVAPPSSDTTTMVFGPSQQGVAYFNASQTVGNIVFTGNYTTNWLMGAGTITLAGNISATPDYSWFGTVSPTLSLTNAVHNLNIDGSSIYLGGTVTGNGSLVKNGVGTLGIQGNNTFTGNVTINQGTVLVGSNSAFGNSANIVTINGGQIVNDYNKSAIIPNKLLLGSQTTFGREYSNYSEGNLTLAGAIEALNTSATINLAGESPLAITGNIINSVGGPTEYRFGGMGGVAILSGTNTYTGGTTVESEVGYSQLLFANSGAVPASGTIKAGPRGYVGALDSTATTVLLNRLDPTLFSGLVGFDTPAGAPLQTFSNPISFDSLPGSARFGTMSQAALTGNITATSYYSFAGNGWLYLRNGAQSYPLTSGIGLSASSFATPDGKVSPFVLVISRSGNTYGGETVAGHGGIIFDATNALPPLALVEGVPVQGAISLLPGGYLGHTETSGLGVPDVASRLSSSTYSSYGILGFDSTEVVNRLTNPTVRSVGDIDLHLLQNPVYIGTASAAVLNGNISTTGNNTHDYFFSGYAGGVLTVNTVLNNSTGNPSRKVWVGLPPEAGGGNQSEVRLMQNNGYTGGTVLYGGTLYLDQSGALGYGPLSAESFYSYDRLPLLSTGPAVTSVTNNIILQGDGLDVKSAGATLTLGGVISGSGHLNLKAGNVTLTGANPSFFGGIDVNGPSTVLTVGHNNATGTGLVYLNEGADLVFTTTAPVVGGLGGGYDWKDGAVTFTSNVTIAAGNTTLTINQPWDEEFGAAIQGAGAPTAKIVKTGPGKLGLGSSNNTYGGGTEILQGVLAAGNTGSLGTGPITIKGGTLIASGGAAINNPISFGPGGGKLGGGGTIGGNFPVGTSIGLTPGESTGTLTFTGSLEWAPGGSYDVEVQSATGGIPGISYDTIAASSLTISANSGGKFNLNLLSLGTEYGPGNVTDFNASMPYSWQIARATGEVGIGGFTAGAFNINLAGFTNSLAGGFFSVSLGAPIGAPSSVDHALFLNFTPVPEPSTWVLMLGGLGTLAAAWYRRRRRSGL